MQTDAIITAAGTLTGVIVSATIAYLIQTKVTERQRKFALEDEKRHVKRESIHKRLSTIEEAAGLMNNYVHYKLSIAQGSPLIFTKEQAESKVSGFQDISGEAWNSIQILKASEIADNWKILSEIYLNVIECGVLNASEAEKANEAYIAIIRKLDELRP